MSASFWAGVQRHATLRRDAGVTSRACRHVDRDDTCSCPRDHRSAVEPAIVTRVGPRPYKVQTEGSGPAGTMPVGLMVS